MKVLVIGATGGTGKHVVRRLLDRGDSVRAFARNSADLTEHHNRLEIVQGDARDAAAIDRAVRGVDAVIVTFGPRSLKKDDLQETLGRNLALAMQQHGVRRVVNLSALGAGDSAAEAGWMIAIARKTIYRHVYADKDRGEAILLGADVDYVNVRPGVLLDTPARGGVKASLRDVGVRKGVAREDLAAFMVEQVRSERWLRKSPLIGY